MCCFGNTSHFIFFRNLYLVKLYGILGTVIFGYFTCGFFKIYRNRNKALVITNEGLLNKTSIFYDGLIRWKDIEQIKKVTYRSLTMIVVTVKNEEEYLSKVPNSFLKFTARQNSAVLGSFLFIPTGDLEGYSVHELERYLKEQWDKFRFLT